ncbi:hypothetical protein Dfri01_47120 [Dyadobacter frigoris]|nr:hypothetical protein Dfri01_47120 [Dyadobacter frigoris]
MVDKRGQAHKGQGKSQDKAANQVNSIGGKEAFPLEKDLIKQKSDSRNDRSFV